MSSIISNKKVVLSIILSVIFLYPCVYAQENTSDFINYLYRTKQFKHLITYSQYIEKIGTNKISSDSINYLKGKSYFQLKEFHQSNNSLALISTNFTGFNESRFLISANSNQINNYEHSLSQLKKIIETDSLIKNFKYFQLSGVSLLKRDIEGYIYYDSLIQKDYYLYESERGSLQNVANNLTVRKNKSPFVGGLLSAVVPGAGRFYAGKRGQAIYSFVISAFFALQTWESYQKSGVNSARFITYGSLFSLFHIGNVWGSALSVKNYNNEYNEAADYRIKMDLLIPIRSFYN